MLKNVESCPLCGGKTKDKLFEIVNNNWRQTVQVTAVKCKDCGLVYFDPDVTEEIKKEYYSDLYFIAPGADKCSGYPNYVESAHLESKKYFGRILKSWISRLNPNAKSILDIGCAVGAMLIPFRDAKWKTVGMDVSDWAVNWGKKNFGLDLRNIDTLGQNKTEKFDVILFWDAFEHFPNPHEILKKVKEIAGPDTIFIFQLPNVEKYVDDNSHFLWSVYQHGCHYSPETFSKLLSLENLEIVKRFPSTQEYEMVFIVKLKSLPAENQVTLKSRTKKK